MYLLLLGSDERSQQFTGQGLHQIAWLIPREDLDGMYWRIPDQFQHLFDLGFHAAGHVRACGFSNTCTDLLSCGRTVSLVQ